MTLLSIILAGNTILKNSVLAFRILLISLNQVSLSLYQVLNFYPTFPLQTILYCLLGFLDVFSVKKFFWNSPILFHVILGKNHDLSLSILSIQLILNKQTNKKNSSKHFNCSNDFHYTTRVERKWTLLTSFYYLNHYLLTIVVVELRYIVVRAVLWFCFRSIGLGLET